MEATTTFNWTRNENGDYTAEIGDDTVTIAQYRGNEYGSRNGRYWAWATHVADPYSPPAMLGSNGAYDPTLADAKASAEAEIRYRLAR